MLFFKSLFVCFWWPLKRPSGTDRNDGYSIQHVNGTQEASHPNDGCQEDALQHCAKKTKVHSLVCGVDGVGGVVAGGVGEQPSNVSVRVRNGRDQGARGVAGVGGVVAGGGGVVAGGVGEQPSNDRGRVRHGRDQGASGNEDGGGEEESDVRHDVVAETKYRMVIFPGKNHPFYTDGPDSSCRSESKILFRWPRPPVLFDDGGITVSLFSMEPTWERQVGESKKGCC